LCERRHGVVVRGDVGGRKKKIPFPRKHTGPSEFLCTEMKKTAGLTFRLCSSSSLLYCCIIIKIIIIIII